MIKLFADIELLSGNNDKFSTATCNIDGLENSANVQDVLGKSVTALNPFVIGDKFENQTLEQNLEYYHGSIYSDNDGHFQTPYVIEFTTKSPIDTFFVAFDTYNKFYPKSVEIYAYIDGTMTKVGKFKDDDVQWEFKLSKSSTQFKIVVSDWSAANKPFVLTGIYADLKIHLDYKQITDISGGVVTQSDFRKPSYGIVSNSGTISFNDFYNEISDYIELGLLKEGALVNIWIENSLVKSQKYKVCEMYTDKWTYDEENKTVSVSLVDGLEKMQDIEFEGIAYYPRISTEMTYKEIYDILATKTKKFGIKVKEYATNVGIMFYLNDFKNPYPYMESSSLWSAWQKFAESMCAKIYKDENGELAIYI